MANNSLDSVPAIPFSEGLMASHGSKLHLDFKLWPNVLNPTGIQEVRYANVIASNLLHHLLLFCCIANPAFDMQV